MSKKREKTAQPLSERLRRAARFSVDLSTPMIFCVAEAVVFLTILSILNLFFKSSSNEKNITLITLATLIFYILSAGTLCIFYSAKAYKIKKAKQDDLHAQFTPFGIRIFERRFHCPRRPLRWIRLF